MKAILGWGKVSANRDPESRKWMKDGKIIHLLSERRGGGTPIYKGMI